MASEHPDIQPSTDHSRRPPGRKRQRVSVACRSCRTRKSRCDGSTPCSTCYDLGFDCHYEQPSQSAPVAAGSDSLHPSILDQRLQTIEKRLDSLVSIDRYRVVPAVPSPVATSSSVEQLAAPSDRNPETQTDPAFSRRDDGVDGMGAVSLKDEGDEEEYFGESSNVAFLRFIVRTIGCSNNGEETTRRQRTDTLAQSKHGNSNPHPRNCTATQQLNGNGQTHENMHSLPSKEDADGMVHLYFTTVNLMIPCIHEDSFRQMYQYMWRHGPQRMSKPWLGSLNLIFAIAKNIITPTSPPHDRAFASNAFYRRAMDLVKTYMFGPISLDLMQVFLLAVVYLEGTTSSSLVWTFHGMAVKSAYQLGLHSITSADISEIDCEIRRRLWHWCVLNDRFLSVAYGRPPLIPLSHVRLQTCSSHPFSNMPVDVHSSSLAYFNALMSLTYIIGSTVDQMYGQNLGFPSQISMSEFARRISELQWQLAQWQDNLPHFLKTITYGETLNCGPISLEVTRLRVLLSLRYQGACVLVLRPILRQFLTPSFEPSLSQLNWLQSHGAVFVADLVQKCKDVIELSKNILVASKEDKNLLGAWWFSCFYTFNSSLAVIGVLLLQKSWDTIHLLPIMPTELRAVLDTAMEILLDLDGGSKTIVKCRDTLSRLLAIVDSKRGTDEAPTSPFTLTPSSLWAWQGLDQGLLRFDASLLLAPETTNIPDIP
ncbi:fungal-specific transcription factor domain-containing protein [Aspergillus bertholletiae]|uniref:Fungal-specific transcription factor domain-containing protein n=1 Tax=Aspergillus bertholletiae TaxID=1226010 RepID=A0A5N7BKS4_9EURO|nr:fungal-specific transcription factor domain-containing protein [Aspergillus bertholletiae]